MKGNSTTIVDVSGKTYDAHYSLMSLAYPRVSPQYARQDITGSRRQRVNEYDADMYDARLTLGDWPFPHTGPPVTYNADVLAGSRRVEVARLLEAQNRYARYKEPLVAKASRFGLNPAEVASYYAPLLVRELDTEIPHQEDRIRFARLANMTPEMMEGKYRQIQRDAQLFGPLLDSLQIGPGEGIEEAVRNPKNRDQVIQALRNTDLTTMRGMIDKDGISPAGARRLQIVSASKMLTNPWLLLTMAEDM